MADKTLVNYIQEQLKKGHDAATIRNHLLEYGYAAQDVDDAVKEIYSPEVKHIIHFSPTTLISIAVIFVSLIAVSFFFYNFFTKAPEQLLDLNLEPIDTTVKAGQEITFLTEITNLGSAKRYDVNLEYEIINLKTNKVLTFKEETRGIETIGSKQTKIDIPSDADSGDYVLRTIATYNGQRAVATLPVKIEEFRTDEETEEQVVEEPVEEEIPEEEEPEDTTEDETAGTDALTTFETLEKVEAIATQDKEEAEKLCKQLELQTSRDLCFNKLGEVLGDKTYCNRIVDDRTKDVCLSNVAKLIDNSQICQEISKDSRKDSCYMNFVIDKKDYTVCDQVVNQYLKQSCKSLEQLSKLNITDVTYYESIINQSILDLV